MSRNFFAVEVVQSSQMDCGPACLKSLLEGFGVRASYGRLREACHTGLDGSSIDVLEEVLQQSGLKADQVMVPMDHLFSPAANLLPALVVVRQPAGPMHFVIAWRRFGNWLQIMDPASGRQWVSLRAFQDQVFHHEMAIPAEDWRGWAASTSFLKPLQDQLRTVGLSAEKAADLTIKAGNEPDWIPVAALDAACRMVRELIAAKAISRGPKAAELLDRSWRRAIEPSSHATRVIPSHYWSVKASPGDAAESLWMNGAVLVHVAGLAPVPNAASGPEEKPKNEELAAALSEPAPRPLQLLWQTMTENHMKSLMFIFTALLVGSTALAVEALIFRAFLEVPARLVMAEQRLYFALSALLLLAGMAMLEWPLQNQVLRLGCSLEMRMRTAFLEKIPRLSDRYFQSRLTGDMAERNHAIHYLRDLPEVGRRLVRACTGLACTLGAMIWLAPSSTWVILVAGLASLLVPIALHPLLAERDLKVHTLRGALSRVFLDAFLGLVPIRAHGAEQAVQREHEDLLSQWSRASLSLLSGVLLVESHLLIGIAGTVALIYHHHLIHPGSQGLLLLVYWALHLPRWGADIAASVQQYPSYRSMTLRLQEPLIAPEEPGSERYFLEQQSEQGPSESPSRGVRIELKDVQVVAAGSTILQGIDLHLEAGCQVALVGHSGAGKSTLAALLLGLHKPAHGRLLVDGEPLDFEGLRRLRKQTVWVDPSVQLWNRSLLENLHFGNEDEIGFPIQDLMDGAHLNGVLETLPDGFQTTLGEAGGLVSGGEGMRVRLGRALGRQGVRLVVLDEAFRGLEGPIREKLVTRARQAWPGATLLAITHDLDAAKAFDRVLLMEGGRLVETGNPTTLAKQKQSRFRAMLDAQDQVRKSLWRNKQWRQITLRDGRITELTGERP